MSHSDFDDAWREFATRDAQVEVPPRLRDAVMAAWDIPPDTCLRPPARPRAFLLAAATLAAAVAVAVAAAALRNTVRLNNEPAVPLASGNEANAVVTVAPLLVLMADPPFDEEPLQLVHLRLSRTSLEAIGITPLEPEASKLIDVEVVVGSDGLPRAVRALRPVLETGGL